MKHNLIQVYSLLINIAYYVSIYCIFMSVGLGNNNNIKLS